MAASSLFSERDLHFSASDFQAIRTLIYQRAGIVLAEHKKDMVYSRVGRLVRARGLTRFADYLAGLKASGEGGEWQAFVNALTTNLTSFFRESHHFPILADHVRGRRDPVRVWSAAASTGEEPYSIVMTLLETLGEHANVEVLATDIDTEALDRARRAVYPLEQVARLDDQRRRRFFQKGSGARTGYARVKPALVAKVRFQVMNLVARDWPSEHRFDAIFCRNVMIYFDRDTQTRVLGRLADRLKPDGLLFAGHSENVSYLSDRFRSRGQTVYSLA
ncbi:CheR family methyltransferase [Alloalcanivorax xenomutans]|uniref:Chemotaxis protein methyltransferase n=1 Tax=Alloalcanivorax xenomutans TaxID=1094342 RepID=A0A9Q3ZHY8_9GAMM|nr:CheR family methyltransferase [Alloalcanivorax xenomutans]MBA4723257.1 chemotaxis protein CheR [Alcanivorax sp.]MCE7509987.1 chemotaxis protein CheR [Alloalcanivorax xenomutans]MCE7522623.1 chemotaxis protein CheR [Alloalcanivorax xenomutans]PHS69444.1 MAG: chemotaxis protein CheR [Alcanivorax sp.]WOA33640.1 CheR family methyltransferase [Alloalcanivorax xenomutans]